MLWACPGESGCFRDLEAPLFFEACLKRAWLPNCQGVCLKNNISHSGGSTSPFKALYKYQLIALNGKLAAAGRERARSDWPIISYSCWKRSSKRNYRSSYIVKEKRNGRTATEGLLGQTTLIFHSVWKAAAAFNNYPPWMERSKSVAQSRFPSKKMACGTLEEASLSPTHSSLGLFRTKQKKLLSVKWWLRFFAGCGFI